MIQRLFLPFGLLLAAALLAGCSQQHNFADIKAKMKTIQEQPAGHIKPAPTFKPAATFSYSVNQLRSPFVPPRGSDPKLSGSGAKVKPNLKRPREYLEQFDLGNLEMVGTLVKQGQPLEALILDPTGTVTTVKRGNHLGKNYGKIKKISAQSVSLMEIIPDGRNGWVQRPKTLRLMTTVNK